MASRTFAGRRRPEEASEETAAAPALPVVITPEGDTLAAQQPEPAAPAPADPEADEALPEAAEAPSAKPKRARKPAGAVDGGEFQGDDKTTPDVNEAWEQG